MSHVASGLTRVLPLLGGLLLLASCGSADSSTQTTAANVPASWQTVSFDAGSFSVPPDWVPGDPAAWCGEKPAHVSRYTVPGDGGSISIGCGNPQNWYGAVVRSTASADAQEGAPIQYESLDGQHTYPAHAWVVSAPIGHDLTLTVVASSQGTATMVVNSLKVAN